MFRNNIKTAVRNLLKNKTVALINVIGLAIGLASLILIMGYISHELSYDKFHSKGDRIYRCVFSSSSGSGMEASPQIVAAVGPSLNEDFTEIEKTVRFRYPETRYLDYNHNSFNVKNVLYADSTLFDVFSFKLLQGNSKTALDGPFSIVLSASTAEKIFGKEDPIGKMITLDNKDLLTVTGIVEEAPSNSHIQYNAFISFSSLYQDPNRYLDWNGGNAYYSYMLVKPNTNMEALKGKLPAFMDKHLNYRFEGSSWSVMMLLQPLNSIYLHSNLPGEIGPTGKLAYLILFAFIAFLIFIIACINFINLTTARLTTRLRETGIRKILGASQMKILMQFMTESIVMNLIALLLAFIIAESFLPLINKLLGQSLTLYQASTIRETAGILVLIIIIAVLAGSYPAFFLSSMDTTLSVKNAIVTYPKKFNLRIVTAIVQYTVSVAMIICTLFLYKQLHFIRHKDPGFERVNTLVIPLPTAKISEKRELLKSDFLKINTVENIAACSEYPGWGFTKNGYVPEGYQDAILIHELGGDEDLLPVLGLQIKKGRNFSKSLSTDKGKYLVNEALVREMNWDDPIGKMINRNTNHEIIGVFNDFNFATLHEKIAPLIITLEPESGFSYLLVRANSSQMQETTVQLKKRWNMLVPEVAFDYFYLDEANRRVYYSEQNLSNLLLLFTILAIFIAFLGLFGLSFYETERRTKSIGIRKVNGARSVTIWLMLSRNYTGLVLFSFILACPLAFYIMHKWLGNFAYKTPLSWWVFVLSGAVVLMVALIAISWQSWRAANMDPVEALRYE